MLLSLIGYEESGGQVTHWKFRVNMNSNWYLDGTINIPIDSDLILSVNAVTFGMSQ